MGEKKYNLNFMAPAPWGLKGGATAININAIFKKNLYSWASSSQTAGMIVISIELSTKNSEIHGRSVRGSGARVGLNDYIVKMH